MMKDIPLTAQCTSMVASIGIGGFLLRIFEQPLKEVSGQDFNYANSFWNVIVTMSTVGYGDFFPKTHMGRFVGVMICLWGVVVVSIFVVTITNMLSFDPTEEKTYSLLQRLSYKEELKRQATKVLAAAYKGRSILKKNSKNSRSYVGSIRDFRKNILSFQKTARTVRSFYEGDTDIEILGKSVEGLYDEIGNIKSGMESIEQMLTEMKGNNLNPGLRPL
jgi:potassium intermediate/small conductance calcium-activated channel subfamily N protein 2